MRLRKLRGEGVEGRPECMTYAYQGLLGWYRAGVIVCARQQMVGRARMRVSGTSRPVFGAWTSAAKSKVWNVVLVRAVVSAVAALARHYRGPEMSLRQDRRRAGRV